MWPKTCPSSDKNLNNTLLKQFCSLTTLQYTNETKDWTKTRSGKLVFPSEAGFQYHHQEETRIEAPSMSATIRPKRKLTLHRQFYSLSKSKKMQIDGEKRRGHKHLRDPRKSASLSEMLTLRKSWKLNKNLPKSPLGEITYRDKIWQDQRKRKPWQRSHNFKAEKRLRMQAFRLWRTTAKTSKRLYLLLFRQAQST